MIPNFDFSGTVIGNSNTPSSSCDSDAGCIGYNSVGELKNDFKNPINNITRSFNVHPVQSGMYFVQLHGWDSTGGNMVNMPLTVPSASVCAYKVPL